MNTMITIYDAEKVGPPSFTQGAMLWLFGAPYEHRFQAAIMWTDKVGGMGDDPTSLTINTMAWQFVFTVPRLVFMNNRQQVFSALSDRDASGTLRTIKKYYILVEKTCENC